MNFREICRERYSVRSFSARRVERETLDGILALLRLAPTALNHQPYRVLVAESDEALAAQDASTRSLINFYRKVREF